MNRKAVSGAISGIFIVLIFFIAIAAVVAYHEMQDKYNETVNERNQLDWERFNEKIIITGERLDDGNLSAIVQNIGAVPTHLVALWLTAYDDNNNPQWQRRHKIDIWVGSGETKTDFGQNSYSYTLIRPGQTAETLEIIELSNESWTYSIKIITERGNIATCIITPPEEEEGAEGDYPIIIATEPDNFQYKDNTHADWTYAWIKDVNNNANQHPVYRVKIINTTNKTIEIDSSSFMVQSGGTAADEIRYIVGSSTDPADDFPAPFTSQIFSPGESDYIYYAANEDTSICDGSCGWVADPGGLPYCPVSFVVNFRYSGEPDLLTLGLPVQVMQLQ